MIRRFLMPVVCAGLLAFLGCGDDRPKRVPVSGQVLIDGKPLEFGTIQVIPENSRAAHGKIGKDGRFQLTTYSDAENDGCIPGKHKVAIIATETIDAQSQRWHAPKKYMSPATSELTVEITEPADAVLIQLTWAGDPNGKPWVERASAE